MSQLSVCKHVDSLRLPHDQRSLKLGAELIRPLQTVLRFDTNPRPKKDPAVLLDVVEWADRGRSGCAFASQVVGGLHVQPHARCADLRGLESQCQCDEAVEDAINDSYAMRRAFTGLDFGVRQVPDATTLLHFRHLLEKHQLGEAMFAELGRIFDENGWVMRGGTVVDATIIAAPSSTRNATGTRDPEMRQTQKGNQWYFGMKAHIGVDAGTGYVHTVTATAASVHDVDQAPRLVRADDEVVYGDAGYQGITKRPDIVADAHLSKVEYRISARKGKLKTMTGTDRAIETRKASVRSKVEHPFLILKRDFGFTKTRYRGLGKNLNRLHVASASANLLMRARAVGIMTG